MKNLSLFLSLCLCGICMHPKAQVLSRNALPLEKVSKLYTYSDTVNRQPVPYIFDRIDEGTKPLLFKLNTAKIPANFSVKINGTTLSASKPTASLKANAQNAYVVELTRNSPKAAFVETAYIQVVDAEKDSVVHDLSFSYHSNKALKRVFVETCMTVNCPFCVIAHAVHRELSGMYPDLFNGVSLHVNLATSNDPMVDIPYWEKLYDKKGVPAMLFDRTTFARGSKEVRPVEADAPNGLSLKMFKERMDKNVFTGLTGSSAHVGNNNFEVRGAMTFYAPTETKNYKVGVAVIENNYQGKDGSYSQENGAYSGGAKGVMGGFEKMSPIISYVFIKYHQVARGFLPQFEGVSSKLPDQVKAGERVEFALTLPFPKSVGVRENARAILVVFDGEGHAINSVEVPIQASFPVANEKIALPEVAVKPYRGGAVVSGVAGKHIRIYSLKGTLLTDRIARSDEETFSLPQGIAIIAVEGMAAKKMIIQ